MNQINQRSRNPSTLALLRRLVPDRDLSYEEGLRIAELQANRLRSLFDLADAAMPDEIIEELPRIRVVRERGLPVSGAAHWNGSYWIITLNADEPACRQKFSLLHEFKHVLDHTSRHHLYYGRFADERSERVADYFAACALMPKRLVKSLWCQGAQEITSLSRRLGVSPIALTYRLQSIGLLDRPSRCELPMRLARPTRRAMLATSGGLR